MKIEKLITLSQFVDANCTDIENLPFPEAIVDSVRDYNNFLKQPLTKEMFVNPLSNPESLFKSEDATIGALAIFEEAEKKVIFDINQMDEYCWSVENTVKHFKTIDDLAEATNGELTLKNVNI